MCRGSCLTKIITSQLWRKHLRSFSQLCQVFTQCLIGTRGMCVKGTMRIASGVYETYDYLIHSLLIPRILLPPCSYYTCIHAETCRLCSFFSLTHHPKIQYTCINRGGSYGRFKCVLSADQIPVIGNEISVQTSRFANVWS